mmetsp:Transcript_24614/g.38235  ORF Transcript_24614/g.38235 Transcript_24614/m.38235 type:complete len:236 (+) Transcript_24614:1701-2408(+)
MQPNEPPPKVEEVKPSKIKSEAKGGFEILISEKDQEIIEKRREQEQKHVEEIEKNYYEYNQYMKMIGNILGAEEQSLPSVKEPEPVEEEKDEEPESPNPLETTKLVLDEEEQEEIDFDQLLGDAAQSQAEYDEDREDHDDFEEDEEEAKQLEEVKDSDLGDSLNFTQSLKVEEPKEPAPSGYEQMWRVAIEMHGKERVSVVYNALKRHGSHRFSEQAQREIAEQVNQELPGLAAH